MTGVPGTRESEAFLPHQDAPAQWAKGCCGGTTAA